METNTSLTKEELEYYLPYIERIKEIEYTKPISMEQIMKVVEVASHNSEYGIFNSDELLHGIYGGDLHDVAMDDRDKLKEKLRCMALVRHMINVWHR